MSSKVIKSHTRKINGGKTVIRVAQSSEASRSAKATKVRMAKAHKAVFGK